MKEKKNVYYLSIASFFTDVSSEMIFSVMPLFMAALGLSKTSIGLIEGVAQATASILKTVSGWLSDRVHFRKPFVLVGYTLSTIAKPFFALANLWYHVLAVRFVDRVGKGIRTAPRDALITDSVNSKEYSSAFGMNRAYDTAGAVMGALLASFLIYWFSHFYGFSALAQYRTIFWLSVFPGAVAVIVVALYVKDVRHKIELQEKSNIPLTSLKKQYKSFLLVSGVFELAKFSYALFILRAADLGVPVFIIPIIYMFYNIVYAMAAQPVGKLADRIGVKKVLTQGYLLLCFTHLGFAFSTTYYQAWLFFLVYGVSMAVIEVMPRSMVAHFSSADKRGAAFGYYHTTIGIMALPATAIAGVLWDTFNPFVSFSYGAGIAIIAAIMLNFLVKSN